MDVQAVDFDVHSLPIKTLARKTKIPLNHFVGKAGIQFRNWKGEWESLCGFSFHHDEVQAKQIARFELLERLLARYEIQCKILKNVGEFQAFSWPSWESKGYIKLDKIFIGRNPFSLTGIEAAGLALRENINSAAEHAIFELLERHLCAKLWYTKELNLTKIISDHIQNYATHFYTLDAVDIPFVMVEVVSTELKTASYGHAIRSTYKEASQKALSEALMLLDCLLYEDNGICSNELTKKRIFSLQGDLVFERHQYLQSIVTNTKDEFPENQFDCYQIIKNIIEDESDISIVPLFRDEKINVVRALSTLVDTLADRRYFGNTSSTNILDPFC